MASESEELDVAAEEVETTDRTTPSYTPSTRKEPFRVPGYFAMILGILVGWAVAQIPGAIMGGIVGLVAWRMRA